MTRDALLLLFSLFAVAQAGLFDFGWAVPWRVTPASTPTHSIASTAYVPMPSKTAAPVIVTSKTPSAAVPTTLIVSRTSAKPSSASASVKTSTKSISASASVKSAAPSKTAPKSSAAYSTR